jgi:hypothetical protein
MGRRNRGWGVLSKMRDERSNAGGMEGVRGDFGNGRLRGVCTKVRGYQRGGFMKYNEIW